MDAPSFSKAIEKQQRDCDYVSFFVQGHVFEELVPLQIAKHDCGHLINVIDKLTRHLDRDLDAADAEESEKRETILKNEVTPDLFIYAVQIATAFKVDWLLNYGKSLPPAAFNKMQEISRRGRMQECSRDCQESTRRQGNPFEL